MSRDRAPGSIAKHIYSIMKSKARTDAGVAAAILDGLRLEPKGDGFQVQARIFFGDCGAGPISSEHVIVNSTFIILPLLRANKRVSVSRGSFAHYVCRVRRLFCADRIGEFGRLRYSGRPGRVLTAASNISGRSIEMTHGCERSAREQGCRFVKNGSRWVSLALWSGSGDEASDNATVELLFQSRHFPKNSTRSPSVYPKRQKKEPEELFSLF